MHIYVGMNFTLFLLRTSVKVYLSCHVNISADDSNTYTYHPSTHLEINNKTAFFSAFIILKLAFLWTCVLRIHNES